MKRILIYILILLAVFTVQLERTDVGKLRPVQTVAIYRDGDDYVIATDTGDRGRGDDPVGALADLKATTAATIYLDTAQFLLTSKDAVDAVEQLRPYLKNTVELYSFRGTPELETVSKYLSVHGSAPRLKHWGAGKALPVLVCSDGQMRLVKRNE